MDGVSGVGFAVWAPNARRVSVVGDFCAWDGRIYPMRVLGSSKRISVETSPPSSLYALELVEGRWRIIVKPRFDGANSLDFSCIDLRLRHHHERWTNGPCAGSISPTTAWSIEQGNTLRSTSW